MVVKEYTLKSEYAKTGLRAKFLGMRCTDKGGVREFLEGLRLKKEELSQAGVDIDEKDYFSVIVSSFHRLCRTLLRAKWRQHVFPEPKSCCQQI